MNTDIIVNQLIVHAFNIYQIHVDNTSAIICAETPESPMYWVQVKIVVNSYFPKCIQVTLGESETGCSVATWSVQIDLLPIVLQQAITLSNHHSAIESIA